MRISRPFPPSRRRHWPVRDAASEDTGADYTIQGPLSSHKGTNIRLQVQRLTMCRASNKDVIGGGQGRYGGRPEAGCARPPESRTATNAGGAALRIGGRLEKDTCKLDWVPLTTIIVNV